MQQATHANWFLSAGQDSTAQLRVTSVEEMCYSKANMLFGLLAWWEEVGEVCDTGVSAAVRV